MLRSRVRRTISGGLLAAVAAVGLAACTATSPGPNPGSSSTDHPSSLATEKVAPGDIPDTQAYVVTKAPSGRWSLKVPEGWSQQTVPGGVLFTDKLNVARAVERTAAQAPTVASVRADEVPALQAAHTGLQVGSVATFTRTGGSGVVVRYQVDSAKDPVTGKVHRDAAEEYLFFKAGKEVVVTLSGAAGADNVDPWKIITGSFRWLR